MDKHWSKQLFWIHRITGLVAGIMLLLASCSGSLLVFNEEIDQALNAHLHQVRPGAIRKPIQEQLSSARRALRGGHPYLLVTKLPEAPTETTVIRAEYSVENKVYLFVNPYTAEVIAQRGNKDYFMGWLLYFHFSLLAGKTGAQVMLVTGILLFLSLLTGTWIYRKSFRKVLTFKAPLEWHKRKRRWRNLHRIIGVWAVLFNLLIAFTGVLMECKIIDARKNPAAIFTEVPVNADYDRLMIKAESQIPGLTVMGIRPPKKAGDPVRFLGHARESAIWGEYPSAVSFDPASGAIVKTIDFSKATFGDKFNACISPLHFGNYGGILVKILYSLFALTPGILSVSGFLIWYRRKFIIKTHRNPLPQAV
ncbi:PepSY-associated TM helix domain-containing protein [Chitinophaga vietnamensis]|uniref:PepSY-associated TM helix domain-containing protein n=1 Tax=Chitinophaga vietnamensis TaxID=2593957 RepID=UPI00117768B2|nr:PepSY-associated TM helix domain-containing protein [Chitinophaga vietnamensis]